ncbi:MAG: peptide chain release factor 1 [Sedimentisphaerales bacterium]|nr:peptide chain release factor 1 [Sedimentisphaerales bacterium]
MAEENNPFIAKLDEIEARYVEIEGQLAEVSAAGDSTRLVALSKEQGKLKAVVNRYREYKKIVSGIEETQELLAGSKEDAEMRSLAEDELGKLEPRRDSLFEEIVNSLVMAEDMNVNSVIVEIRAGTGGEEAALFARDLYNMYVKYAEGRKWKIEQLSFSAAEMGGFKDMIFGIKGNGAWAELGYEGGGHRVQRVPETESQGRVHTSAATVAVLPEPEEPDIEINPADVEEHVSRSGGPGGQSVNKLNSAVKLEHVPTGITVSMQDEKSQHKNRAKAWRILRSRIYEHFESKRRAQRDSQRKTMIGSGDRSQKIRTYNFPQNRVTDHRINLSLYSLDKIMAGDMGELISGLRAYDREQRLKNF